MSSTSNQRDKIEFLKKHVNSYPDFPIKGVLFRDIFSILKNNEALKCLMDVLVDHVTELRKRSPIDAIIGLDSRGFLFGPYLSIHFAIPFIPIRKKGKLPGITTRVEYQLEYSSDAFEIQNDGLDAGQSVLIVDDLLATGGTMEAACNLVNKLGVNVTECLVVMELVDLKGKDKLKAPFASLIQY